MSISRKWGVRLDGLILPVLYLMEFAVSSIQNTTYQKKSYKLVRLLCL